MAGALALIGLLDRILMPTVRWYLKRRMNKAIKILNERLQLKIQPFTINTIKIIGVILVLFGLFYFLNFTFHPLINITLKCVIIGVVYLILIKKLQVSEDINSIVTKYLQNKND